MDSEAKRLYVTRGNRVAVLDSETGKEVGEIPGTEGVHGVALAKELKRGFASNGASNSVTIFDLGNLKTIGKVPTGIKPDAIVYDPSSKRVLAFNGGSNSVTVIDAVKGTAIASIDLGGKPEFAAVDSSGKVFVNIEDKHSLVAIDPVKPTKLAEWPLSPCEEPTGLAMDTEHHRLFSACHNQRLIVMNSENGKVVTSLPIGKGVDAAAFDPATQLVFTSNGEGTLTVIHENSPDSFSVVDTVATQKSARTMALDPGKHRVYTVAAKFEQSSASNSNEHHKRPTMIPGSAVLLVLDQD